MSNDKGLIYAFLLDGQGGGKAISWPEIDQWTPGQGILWLHFDCSKPSVAAWLKKKSSLDIVTISALTADESRPRAIISEHNILLSLRGVNTNPGKEPEDMVSIRVWADSHQIITTRRRKLLSVQDIRNLLEQGSGPTTTGEFLTKLAELLTYRASDIINEIEDTLDELEEKTIESFDRTLQTDLSTIRHDAILIRRYLSPQREALQQLSRETTNILTQVNHLQCREITDRVTRYVEDLDTVRDRANIVQEQINNKISQQVDTRMYTLSLVAVIFLPITFLTGLLGINVGGIPGSANKFSFLIVCLISLLIGFTTFLIFKRKRWM